MASFAMFFSVWVECFGAARDGFAGISRKYTRWNISQRDIDKKHTCYLPAIHPMP